MKKIKQYKPVCLLLCFFLFFTLLPVSVKAEETKSKVVRVGWYEDSYHITDKNGDRTGRKT